MTTAALGEAGSDSGVASAVAAECPGALQGPELWSRVHEVYEAAQASGAAKKTDTEVHLVDDQFDPDDPSTKVKFVVRLATALRAKPQGMSSKPPEATVPPAPVNPFLPYEHALWVAHLSKTHTLLLNKFNVVAHHVLVVTRAFESQQDPLNARDLAAAWTTLHAMPQGGVAFYNCGPHSGRSQPHKHMQVVPLPLAENIAFSGAPLQPIALAAAVSAGARPHQPVAVTHLPYRCYAAVLDLDPSPGKLEHTFNELLHMAWPLVFPKPPSQEEDTQHSQQSQQSAQQQPQPPQLPVGEAPSYNVVLTRETMMVVPRSQETCGPLAINSLGFAGTILVRSQEDAEYVKSVGPAKILKTVGEPW